MIITKAIVSEVPGFCSMEKTRTILVCENNDIKNGIRLYMHQTIFSKDELEQALATQEVDLDKKRVLLHENNLWIDLNYAYQIFGRIGGLEQDIIDDLVKVLTTRILHGYKRHMQEIGGM